MEFQSLNFDLQPECNSLIKVIGVGGGGSNAVNYMYNQGIKGVDFIICNTDAQALEVSPVPHKIQLGANLTEGRGAGSSPLVGRDAALESIEAVRNILHNEKSKTSMVFITAGMGGGTGTGAAPIIAQMCKEMGILTVGIITVPFTFEGKMRHHHAEEGVKDMRNSVDTLLIIRNDKLRELFGNLTMNKAFGHADEVLCTAAKGIAEVMTLTGLVNVDMNDVKTVMKDSGVAIMGSGRASGENRAKRAVETALESPLLNDNDIYGAKHVLLNITHGEEELLMDEVTEITDAIQDRAGMNANVIWGYGQDNRLGADISVTVIATGWDAKGIDNVIPGIEVAEQVVVDVHVAAEEVAVQKPIAIVPEVTQPIALVQEVTQPLESPVMRIELEEISNGDVQLEPVGLNINDEAPLQQNEVVFEIEIPEEPKTIELFEMTTEVEAPKMVQEELTFEKEEVKMKFNVQENVNEDVFQVLGFGEKEVSAEQRATAPEASLSLKEKATDSIDRSSINQLQIERSDRIKQICMKLKSPGGLNSLEDEPAYLRKKVVLDNPPASNESQASRFGISETTDLNGEKRYGLSDNNPFLHDNVD
jgi:cell division protein FtsZ